MECNYITLKADIIPLISYHHLYYYHQTLDNYYQVLAYLSIKYLLSL